MMKILNYVLSASLLVLLGCSPVKLPVSSQYQLSAFNGTHRANHVSSTVLLITHPEAVSAYQTEAMLYMRKPFKLETFAHNAWSATPADMLYPLLLKTMQKTAAFHAITTSPYSEEADYRLDSQILDLKQNFLKKPSTLEMTVKVVFTHIKDNHVLGSKIITLCIPCPSDTPYGGVLAANRASYQLTGFIAAFVLRSV
jgi:cholesterol transport system auxiliary component